jgi:RsiW-degrading membrane proteinase PrsW (M82 family)
MLENIYYVYLRGGLGDPYAVAIVRSFTAVPAHAIFGAVMGINFARYKFKKSKDKSYLTLALVIPYLLHGLYNFLIQTNYPYGLLLVLCGVIYVLKKYNDEIKLQKKRRRN